MKRIFALLFISAANAVFPASQFLQKAEELYMQNKPMEAKPLMEAALNEDPSNEKVYLYLGIIYQQLGDKDNAIAVLQRGLQISTTLKDQFYYNLGCNFESKGENVFAEEMYGDAILANRTFADPYLNRANIRVELEKFDGALSDYSLYLQLKPQDSQRPQIEAVMKILSNILQAQIDQKKEEEARQKALMNDVMNSLSNASEGSKNLSVQALQFKNQTENVDIKE
jgi:tetratricopeptide (TPR) repeat protein